MFVLFWFHASYMIERSSRHPCFLRRVTYFIHTWTHKYNAVMIMRWRPPLHDWICLIPIRSVFICLLMIQLSEMLTCKHDWLSQSDNDLKWSNRDFGYHARHIFWPFCQILALGATEENRSPANCLSMLNKYFFVVQRFAEWVLQVYLILMF